MPFSPMQPWRARKTKASCFSASSRNSGSEYLGGAGGGERSVGRLNFLEKMLKRCWWRSLILWALRQLW